MSKHQIHETVLENRPRRAAFLGSKETGLRIFQCLATVDDEIEWTVLHPDDRNEARSIFSKFEKTVHRSGNRFEVVKTRREARQILQGLQPDIAFVSGWYWLLTHEELALASRGFWGLHYSKLPAYRGGAPLVWALINGEQIVGATVFEISEGMDDGRILLQANIEVDHDEHIASVIERLDQAVVADLPAKWKSVLNGNMFLEEQSGVPSYCGQRSPLDGRINWELSATQIHNFIRAQSPPYPCAYTTVGHETIRISKSRIDARTVYSTPGQVVQIMGDEVLIGCGSSTALVISEVIIGDSVQSPATVFPSTKIRLL